MNGQIGVLAVLVFCSSGAVLAQQGKYLPGEIEGGGRLYQANCTGCHGPEGDGVAAVNFSKGQFRRASSDDDLARIIVSGIPGTPMPPGNFSGSQAARSSPICDRWPPPAGRRPPATPRAAGRCSRAKGSA